MHRASTRLLLEERLVQEILVVAVDRLARHCFRISLSADPYRVIDSSTVESTTYTDGVAGNPVVRQVAPDGMSYIQTVTGTDAQGVAVNNVTVWDRVR